MIHTPKIHVDNRKLLGVVGRLNCSHATKYRLCAVSITFGLKNFHCNHFEF